MDSSYPLATVIINDLDGRMDFEYTLPEVGRGFTNAPSMVHGLNVEVGDEY